MEHYAQSSEVSINQSSREDLQGSGTAFATSKRPLIHFPVLAVRSKGPALAETPVGVLGDASPKATGMRTGILLARQLL